MTLPRAAGVESLVRCLPGARRLAPARFEHAPPTPGGKSSDDSEAERGVAAVEQDGRIAFLVSSGEVRVVPVAESDVAARHAAKEFRQAARYRTRRTMPGVYWAATTRDFVAFESALERSVLISFDFARTVVGILAQPFRLESVSLGLNHVPDFFLRFSDGTAGVVDVSRAADAQKPERAAQFRHSASFCQVAGWSYSVHSELPPVYLANLLALAAERRELPDAWEARCDQMLSACAQPQTIGELAATITPTCLGRRLVLRLLWQGKLWADLDVLLDDSSQVWRRLGR